MPGSRIGQIVERPNPSQQIPVEMSELYKKGGCAFLISDGLHELRRPRESERARGLGLPEVVAQHGLVLSGVVRRDLRS